METIKGMSKRTRQLWRHKSGEIFGIELNNLPEGRVISCVGPLHPDDVPSTLEDLDRLSWTDGITDATWADHEDGLGNFQLSTNPTEWNLMKYTPEPWAAHFSGSHGQTIVDWPAGLGLIAVPSARATIDEQDANAHRLVACVNACEGINPETVPKLLAIAKEVVLFAPEYAGNDDLNAALSDLEAIIGLAEPEGD